MHYSSLAQDRSNTSNRSLNESEIKDLKDLVKYDKTVKRLKPKTREREEISPDAKKVKDGPEEIDKSREAPDDHDLSFSFQGGPILKWLLYLFITALVVFILFTIFSSIKVEKKIDKEVGPKKDDIEDIEVIDADSGLEIALKAENYREAVRMLFIKLLQVLVAEDSIEWKPEKTNRDYLREMRQHPKINHFNNLVIAYERIWYGSEPIDKLFFDYLREDFEKFYSTGNVIIDVKE